MAVTVRVAFEDTDDAQAFIRWVNSYRAVVVEKDDHMAIARALIESAITDDGKTVYLQETPRKGESDETE